MLGQTIKIAAEWGNSLSLYIYVRYTAYSCTQCTLYSINGINMEDYSEETSPTVTKTRILNMSHWYIFHSIYFTIWWIIRTYIICVYILQRYSDLFASFILLLLIFFSVSAIRIRVRWFRFNCRFWKYLLLNYGKRNITETRVSEREREGRERGETDTRNSEKCSIKRQQNVQRPVWNSNIYPKYEYYVLFQCSNRSNVVLRCTRIMGSKSNKW